MRTRQLWSALHYQQQGKPEKQKDNPHGDKEPCREGPSVD